VDAFGGEVNAMGCPVAWRGAFTPSPEDAAGLDVPHESNLCNVDRVPSSELSADAFAERYLGVRPVVVQFPPGWNARARSLSTRAAILRDHGHRNVTLSDATTYSPSQKKVRVSVSEYVAGFSLSRRDDRRYLFGDHSADEWGNIFDVYQRPPYGPDADENAHHHPLGTETQQQQQRRQHWAYSFGLGESGSGVPFHVHGDGWSECLHGSKRWFLYESGVEPVFDAEMATAEWAEQVYPTLRPREDLAGNPPSDSLAEVRPLECTIVPGEALYFPPNWYHATLNVHEGAFISTFL